MSLGTIGALGGCGAPEPGDVASLAQPLGEPVGDRPNYEERVAHYACNRSRADPAAINWPEFPAVPPLLWHDQLAQSGRAHSLDMRNTPCFQHNSCNGQDPFTRIKSFYKDPFVTLGENIAAGVQDGQIVVHNWIEEIGAPVGETGHRESTFSADFTHHGLGYAAGGTRFQGYWTQDFAGQSPRPAIPALASGAHFPVTTNAGGSVTFGTVYYSKTGVNADTVQVVVDGNAAALKRVNGTTAHGAWEGAIAIGAGCHRYYFRAVAGGQVYVYPDAGTIGVATNGTMGCALYMAGGVSKDPMGGGDGGGANPDGGGGGYYGGHGGCEVAGRPLPVGTIAPILVAVLAIARRRRR